MSFDVTISNQGSIVMVTPETQEAKDWVDENVQLEGWQWMGRGFAVEPRYAPYLIEGMVEAGLSFPGAEVVQTRQNEA